MITIKDLPQINSLFGIVLYSLFAYLASMLLAAIFTCLLGSIADNDIEKKKKKLILRRQKKSDEAEELLKRMQ